MTTNIAQGNVVEFIFEFRDAQGNLTSGIGATFSITQNGVVIFSQLLTYTGVVGYFNTVVWNSGSAAIGYATYALTTGGGTISVADQNLRITPPALIL